MRADDVDAIRVYAEDPEIHRHTVWQMDERADTVAFIARMMALAHSEPRTDYTLAIIHDEDFLGTVGLHGLGQTDQWEIGYVLRRDRWGQGFVTEAAHVITDFTFETLGAHHIFGHCAPENPGSWRVMENLGMRREGFELQTVRTGEVWRDAYRYALLREEWDVFRSFAERARTDTQLELSLQRAAPREIEHIHELMRLVGQDMLERFGMDHWEKPFNLAQMQFDARRRETYAVKDADGIVGSFTIGFEPMWPSEVEIPFHDAARPLYLHRLMVHPKYQSRGVGALIMGTAARLGRARGCDRLRLETRSSFTEVRRFYERLGFELRHDYHPEEDWCALDKEL